MQKLSLRQAAKASHRGKTTILNAIQSGRLSATKDENGHYQIDPAELFRVYQTDQDMTETEGQNRPEESQPATAALIEKIKGLEAQLNREQEINRRLFDQLDEAASERRKLTSLLTHQPEKKPEAAPDPAKQETAKRPKKRGFWGMFGKS